MHSLLISANDDASDCNSYYAEYDPFDYLYSSSATQYSDPVYEAVNRWEKSAAPDSGVNGKYLLQYTTQKFENVTFWLAISKKFWMFSNLKIYFLN